MNNSLKRNEMPTLDPNIRNITNYMDPLISYTYEPGSTMKIYTYMATMENSEYVGSKTYKSGTKKVDDATIKDFNGKGWGVITYDTGFANSSNVAATTLALSVGREKLYNYYSSLGFGKKTGITLPNEGRGDIDFTYKTEVATASFGQGITTTPIQNLQALTILTNDGVEIQPYIIEKIVDSNTGKIIKQNKQKRKRDTRMGISFSWRSRRDSNSRAGYPTYALSRGASSPLEYYSK